jgi:hypothetical protein
MEGSQWFIEYTDQVAGIITRAISRFLASFGWFEVFYLESYIPEWHLYVK